MNSILKEILLVTVFIQLCFSKAVQKKKKFKVTTEILADRIVSLSDNIFKMTKELPMGQGATLMQETETLNSCIRQFVKLLHSDEYYDKDIEKVRALGPQPKFLEIELDDEKVATAKKNFGWNEKNIEDWFFVRLCTYQHWNHILTYRNYYQGMT